jgi:ABC-type glycerol-3-phosphate transport system substrate-binding protein
MKNLFKFFAVAALFTVFTVACGGQTETATEEAPATEETVTEEAPATEEAATEEAATEEAPAETPAH